VAVKAEGSFYCEQDGGTFTPTFVLYPKEVQLISYTGWKSYRHAGRKQVAPNEVAVTSMFNNSVPAIGLAKATYSTSVTSYVLEWEMEGDWFPRVLLVVTATDGATGTMTVSPPNRVGV
jgi:hypothetical protein